MATRRPSTSTLPDLISRADLARWLDVSQKTVSRWDARGLLPPSVKLGRLRRYRRDDVERWLEKGCPER